ncbi:MAG TPA: tRNA pseudouridine(38-40) synthase TruA [Thermoanaerobaculia bacterium]|nr:tRNA pseudouridine(38-40) synthase TruA [Thermoanaerobaculia bacterium]
MTTTVAASAARAMPGEYDGRADNGDVRMRLDLAYLGTFFEGWQSQEALRDGVKPRTVQGVLEDSLKEILTEDVRVHGAGRTDSGVHADAQVAHFDVPEGAPALPSRNLSRALNTKLPWDVRVLSVSEVPSDFHARRSAIGKVYLYRLRRGEFLHPHRGLVEALAKEPLDVGVMREAARRLVGRRDFALFSITGSDPRSTVRTLARLDVEEEGDLLLIRAVGDGFLRGMVRRLVGTLRETGRGKTPPQAAPERPGPTAEARGLTLLRVLYPPESLPGVDETPR